MRLKYNTGPLGRGLTCVERRPSRNDNNGCSRPRRAATRAHGGHTLHPRRHPSREQGTLHMPGDQHRLLGLFLFAGVWSLLSLVGLLDEIRKISGRVFTKREKSKFVCTYFQFHNHFQNTHPKCALSLCCTIFSLVKATLLPANFSPTSPVL